MKHDESLHDSTVNMCSFLAPAVALGVAEHVSRGDVPEQKPM